MYEHIGIEKNGKKLTKTDKVKNKVAYILDSVLPIVYSIVTQHVL